MSTDGFGQAREAIIDFVAQNKSRSLPQGHETYKISAYQAKDVRCTHPLNSFEFDGGEDPKSVAQDVMSWIENEIRNVGGGRVRLTLRFDAFKDARLSFTLDLGGDEEEEDEDLDDLEEGYADLRPGTKAILDQSLRHTERAIAYLLSTIKDERRTHREEKRELRAMLREYQLDRIKSVELYESMMTAKSTRELQEREHERSNLRKDQFVQHAIALLPIGINALAKRGIVPSTHDAVTTPFEAMFMGIVSSLRNDQLSRIMSCLDPPQQAALASFLQEAQARHEATEARARAASAAAANGQAGQTGQAQGAQQAAGNGAA